MSLRTTLLIPADFVYVGNSARSTTSWNLVLYTDGAVACAPEDLPSLAVILSMLNVGVRSQCMSHMQFVQRHLLLVGQACTETRL
jgi:hypothetical protein